MDNNRIIQNLKIIKIAKSTGHTDSEIAKLIGVTTTQLLEAVASDPYIKEIWDSAQDALVRDIERQFLANVYEQLEGGDNTDAKWMLERTAPKYQKKDKLEISTRSIDDIIREANGEEEPK